jgi:hypothetical protein
MLSGASSPILSYTPLEWVLGAGAKTQRRYADSRRHLRWRRSAGSRDN